jgi:hypothetical protein
MADGGAEERQAIRCDFLYFKLNICDL